MPTPTPAPIQAIDSATIRDALRRVSDPEAGMNIVDLGLVYEVRVADGSVYVAMTMTSRACPMGEMILEDVEAVLSETLPPGLTFRVELVWSPPWEPSMMSDKARRHFDW